VAPRRIWSPFWRLGLLGSGLEAMSSRAQNMPGAIEKISKCIYMHVLTVVRVCVGGGGYQKRARACACSPCCLFAAAVPAACRCREREARTGHGGWETLGGVGGGWVVGESPNAE
jgi:hypothetical protein